MIDFQAAERKRLEEPASEIGMEPLCAMVSFEDTCKGFLEVAKEAVQQTVRVIFEDPRVQELLVKLYQKEWSEGQITEYLVATFGDYFKDVKMYVEKRSFRRFVEAYLEETVVVYVDHLLMQRNYIKEETIEWMRLDEEVLMDFFREYISVSKVENRVGILSDLRELVSVESLDAFTLIYTNILDHQPDCPPEVVRSLLDCEKAYLGRMPRRLYKSEKKFMRILLLMETLPRQVVFPKVNSLSASKGSVWQKLTVA